MRCALAVRPCKLTPRFDVLASESSGDFVVRLLDKLSEVKLYAVTYKVIEKDGSIRWSTLAALQLEGVLWQEGMTVPLFARELAESRKRARSSGRMTRLHLELERPLAWVAREEGEEDAAELAEGPEALADQAPQRRLGWALTAPSLLRMVLQRPSLLPAWRSRVKSMASAVPRHPQSSYTAPFFSSSPTTSTSST